MDFSKPFLDTLVPFLDTLVPNTSVSAPYINYSSRAYASPFDTNCSISRLHETGNRQVSVNRSGIPEAGNREILTNHTSANEVAGLVEIVIFSLIFFLIGLVGIVGNVLVVLAVARDKKMRASITNLLITNLAAADLIIMIFGVPEIIQFMLNRGWLLDWLLCKTNRFVLVVALYASVLTLVAICVERYIAIVHPIRAHLLCSRTRVALVVSLIWPMALLAGMPTLLYNQMQEGAPGVQVKLCHIRFPQNPFGYYMLFKYCEFLLFYALPLILQVVLYTQVTRHLFTGSHKLRRERASEALLARKGVVKMLVISVLVYFLSYCPQHVLLIYTSVRPSELQDVWILNVLVSVIAYLNSATNPVLYSIFSQNFRNSFRSVMCVSPPGQKSAVQFQRKSTLSTSLKFARVTGTNFRQAQL